MTPLRIPHPPSLLLVSLLPLALPAAGAGAALTPAGPAVRVDAEDPACRQQLPTVRALADGRFVAVWEHRGELFGDPSVRARLFAADGRPLGATFEVAAAPAWEPSVAAAPDGGFVALWKRPDGFGQVAARRFDAAGAPAGSAHVVAEPYGIGRAPVTALDSGGFAFALGQFQRVDARLLDDSGAPAGNFIPIAIEPVGLFSQARYGHPSIDAAPAGFVVAYQRTEGPDFDVFGARVRLPGLADPATYDVDVVATPDGELLDGPAVAAAADGSWLIAWREQTFQGFDHRLWGMRVAPGGNPGPAHRLDPGRMLVLSAPAAAAVEDHFAVAWPGRADSGTDPAVLVRPVGAGGPLGPPLTVHRSPQPAYPSLGIGAGTGLVAWQEGQAPPDQVLAPEMCFSSGIFARPLAIPAEDTLLLGDGRFELTVAWDDPYNGGSGSGHAAPLTDDSGAFWFFDDANLELVVKAIDGRPVNGRFWLFYGSLSSVAFTLEVHDTVTDVRRSYTNPPFELASRGDTSAFPAAGSGEGGPPPQRPEPVNAGAGPCTAPELPVIRRPGLCLGDRFEVLVEWSDPYNGGTGVAEGTELTEDSGTLWFFHPDNAEIALKVLDGRPVNGHYWIFGGSLTSVEYTVTVVDTLTTERWIHHKAPFGFASFADTVALPAEP
jgi:hypothetical protein